MSGRLYLIGTPIGNLGDITYRAVEVLKSLDVLFCEDTRHSAKLLSHIGAAPKTRPLSDDSPLRAWDEPVKLVLQGRQVGFITDAGMPGASDPGRRLCRAAWQAGVTPQVIPGPSALTTLLAACPFVDNSFSFLGYVPRKQSEREQFFKRAASSPEPCLFFDAPLRCHANLDELCAILEPARQVLIGREMTKLHEEILLLEAGAWPEIKPRLKERGEITLAVAAAPLIKKSMSDTETLLALRRLATTGFSTRDSVRALSAVLDIEPSSIRTLAYAQAHLLKDADKHKPLG